MVTFTQITKLSENEIQQIAHYAAQRAMTANPTINAKEFAEEYLKEYLEAKNALIKNSSTAK